MKTNHQRNFKDNRNSKSYKEKYVIGGSTHVSLLADRTISAAAYVGEIEFLSAKKRARKAKAGAKKFVRTRARFHENAAVKKLANDYDVN